MEETIPNQLDLYFDGTIKTCQKQEDRGGEHLYVADDGSFVKFPINYSEKDSFEQAVERYNKANDNVPDVIPDVVYGEVVTFDKNGDPIG